MSKWTLFATNSINSENKKTREQQLRKEWQFTTAIKNLKRLTPKELGEKPII